MSKLNNFGPVYVINLPDNIKRLKNVKQQFSLHGIKNYKICKAVDGRNKDLSSMIIDKDSKLKSQEIGCIASHLSVLRQWLETSESEYAVIMEDDCVLDTVQFWQWDWNYFINNIPKDADIIQLAMIKEKDVKFNVHKKESFNSAGIENYAWSTACYLIKRSYAKYLLGILDNGDKIDLSAIDSDNKAADVTLYYFGNAYSMPIFTYFVDKSNAINIDHKAFHIRSKKYIDTWWETEAKKYTAQSFFDSENGLQIKQHKKIDLAFNIFHVTGESSSLKKRGVLVEKATQRLSTNFTKIETPTILIKNEQDVKNFFSKENIKIDPLGWNGRGWKFGELGIWASNYTAWKNFAKTDHEMLMLMEDDIILNKDFNFKLMEYISELPDDWDFFTAYIPSYGNQRAKVQRDIINIGKQNISRVYQSWSCLCYVVSKQGVKKLLEQVKEPVNGPIDHWLFYNKNLNGYSIKYGLPNICDLFETKSTIQFSEYIKMTHIFNEL